MVSQFVSPHKKQLLCHLNFNFPEGTHAVGRLDEDSEGLLLLTTDKSMTRRLLHPDKKHKRTYVVQVERKVKDETLQTLMNGVEIKVQSRGNYFTKPCVIKAIDKPDYLPPRGHAFREDLPQSWLEITLTEGKNRQIRKMCSAVKHDCKRLIRIEIENLSIKGMHAGEVKELEQVELFKLLNIN